MTALNIYFHFISKHIFRASAPLIPLVCWQVAPHCERCSRRFSMHHNLATHNCSRPKKRRARAELDPPEMPVQQPAPAGLHCRELPAPAGLHSSKGPAPAGLHSSKGPAPADAPRPNVRTGDGRLTCRLCRQTCNTPAAWGFHMWRHTKDARYLPDCRGGTVALTVDPETQEDEGRGTRPLGGTGSGTRQERAVGRKQTQGSSQGVGQLRQTSVQTAF